MGGKMGLEAGTRIVGAFSASSAYPSTSLGKVPERRTFSATAASVHQEVARLVMGSDWPKLGTDDPDSVAHAAAKFLGGVSTDMMPAKNWKTQKCWGKFKNCGDYNELEELVHASIIKIRSAQAARNAQLVKGQACP